jgi:hypothetical protein
MQVCYEGNGSARSRRNAFRSERHKTARCTGILAPVRNLQWLEIPGGFQNRLVIGQAGDLQLQLAGDIEHAIVISEN